MILKIRKTVKILVGFIFISMLILTTGTALLIYFFPEEKALGIIQKRVEENLKTPVTIESLNYSLKGIVLSNISVYDSDTDDRKELLKIDEASILLSLFSLIGDEIHIWSITLKGLRINFIFNKDGTHNYSTLINDLKGNEQDSEVKRPGRSIKITRVVLDDCRLNLVNPPRNYKPLEGEYGIYSTINFKDDGVYHFDNTEIVLPSGRGVMKPELDLILSETFLIRGKVSLEKCSLLWVYKFADNDLGLAFDTVTAEVDNFEITPDHVKGRARGFSTLKVTSKNAVVDGWCTVDLNTLMVNVYNVKGKIDRTSFDLDSLVISGKEGALKSFKASNAAAHISDLRILLDFLPEGLYGRVNGGLAYDGKRYNGRMQLAECGMRRDVEIFSGLTTDVEINNNEIKKENVPVKILGNTSRLSIATTDSSFNSFYVFIQSDSINLNELAKSEISPAASRKKGGTAIPVNVNGKIAVNDTIYDNLRFKNTNIDFNASGSNVRINKISTSTLSGTITGNGRIDLSANDPVINTSLEFKNIKVQDFPFENNELKNRFFGFADGNASLTIGPGKSFSERIKGKVVFNVTKGKLVNTGIQNGLILFLAELRYKLRDMEFNKIYGNIDLDKGEYNINSFIFNSEDIRLSLNGPLGSDLKARDMQMKLEFNNHFIKDIPRPAVAVLNKYQSGRWYIMPFVIRGDITDSKNISLVEVN